MLDNTLSFNDHVEYVKKKVSKTLSMFYRLRPSLTLEAANIDFIKRPVLDFCDIVWHMNVAKGIVSQ